MARDPARAAGSQTPVRHVTATAVKSMLSDGGEIALIDVREHGQYGEGHPFFAVNLPYSRLEALAPRLIPRRAVRCVLVDAGDGVAEKAARRLAAIDYTDVSIMAGGAPAWAAADFTLFKGVNVPSKAFGELVEHEMHTPSISAEELKAALEAGEDPVILDGRTPDEFRRMSLPGARLLPNAELAHRLAALGTQPNSRIVINCAGRTRSIIGAQTLRNLGVPYEVVALRNGTQGWQLAGFDLVRGREPERLPELSPEERARSRETAQRLIRGSGLPVIGCTEFERQRAEPSRTCYLFDVRTAEEFAGGHLPGAIHAPGGQLVQATDQWIAVRGARVILSDDTGLRAATTARWLRGMGHEAAILDVDATEGGACSPEAPRKDGLPEIAPEEVPSRLAAGAALLDLSSSMQYRRAHIAGARWAIRPRLDALDLTRASEILLVAPNPTVAEAAALDLGERHAVPILAVPGALEAWRAAGLEVVATPEDPPDEKCIDYLFFVHDRLDGNLAAARAYLDWETGLLAQLDDQERAVLKPVLSLRQDGT